jgi:hypothetical protein
MTGTEPMMKFVWAVVLCGGALAVYAAGFSRGLPRTAMGWRL